jgi:hypothetical protein
MSEDVDRRCDALAHHESDDGTNAPGGGGGDRRAASPRRSADALRRIACGASTSSWFETGDARRYLLTLIDAFSRNLLRRERSWIRTASTCARSWTPPSRFGDLARVDRHGFIKWHLRPVLVTSALNTKSSRSDWTRQPVERELGSDPARASRRASSRPWAHRAAPASCRDRAPARETFSMTATRQTQSFDLLSRLCSSRARAARCSRAASRTRP